MVERTAPKPATLFYSYSHKDERYRKRLEVHLSQLNREGLLEEWHDRKIVPGQDWKEALDENLKTADIVVLLVSPDFVASDYCYEKEMRRALERHDRGEAKVIPVIVRPVDWERAPFGMLQALPRDAKPVTRWSNRDEAWLDVARGIRRAIEGMDQRLDGERMVLEIKERGLEIYLTGTGVNWRRDPRLSYAETPEGYVLSLGRNDVGQEFKHFVVCNEADVGRIKDILTKAGYFVSGPEDAEPGRKQIWFLLRDFPATGGYEDPFSNNLWSRS